MKKKLKKFNINRIMPILLAVVILLLGTTISVNAVELISKGSSEYQDVYGESAEMGDSVGEAPPPWIQPENYSGGLLEGFISEFIAGIAEVVNNGMENGQVDLSLNAIIYGRVGSTEQMLIDVAHFGLEKNNPYGIMGASLYLILKRVSYAIIPVVLMALLLINLFRNNRKGREKLKELGTNTVIYFLTLEMMPYLVEFYIYVRDFFMYITKEGLADVISALTTYHVSTDSLYSIIQSIYSNSGTIVYALMLVGVAFAGVIYLWDYVKIALLIMVTFGLFPIIVLIMFFKPKIVSDWFDIVIPNLTIPFVDATLMMAPAVMMAVFTNVLKLGAWGHESVGFSLCLVLLCSIFVVKAIRDVVIRKLFNFEGMRGGGGAFVAIMAATRMMFSKGGGIFSASPAGGGGSHASSWESEARATEQHERSELMRDADSRIGNDTPEGSYGKGGEQGGTSSRTDEFINESRVGEDVTETIAGEGIEDGAEMLEPHVLDEIPDNASNAIPEIAENEPTFKLPTPNDDNVTGNDVEEVDKEMSAESKVGDVPNSPVGDSSTQDVINHAYDDIRASEDYGALSERDQRRFENLARMDDMEERIQANNRIIEDAGYDRGNIRQQYKQEYKQEQNNHNELLAKESELKKTRDAITDTSSEEYQKADMAYREVEKNRKSSENRLDGMQRAYNAAQQNVEYSRNLDHYRQVESAYAHNSGLGGMSTRTYNNASDFFNQKRLDQIQKRQADYRNFDSGRFDGVLSPQERENFYRERASQQRRDELAQRAGKVGKVVGGTLGAAAGMYGGASAMTAGAMIGAGIVGKTTEKTAHGISGIGEVNKNNAQPNKVIERNTYVEVERLQSESSAQAERTYMRNEQSASSNKYNEQTKINMRNVKNEGMKDTHTIRNE